MRRDRAELHLRVGPDLWPEPFQSDDRLLAKALRAGARAGGIDGGLNIWCEGQQLGYAHLWDRVDGMLLAWLRALRELQGGAAQALAVFPDTRVECELLARAGGRVGVTYEDISAQVRIDRLLPLLDGAAGRLIQLTARVGVDTAALRALREVHGARPDGGK